MGANINIAEIATLGAQIAELGLKLHGLRENRDELNEQIKALEDALMPLLTQHAALLASFTGAVLPPQHPHIVYTPGPGATPEPVSGVLPVNSGMGAGGNIALSGVDTVVLKRKIQTFLQGREGASAMEIAESLHVDPTHVRHIMIQMAQGQVGQGSGVG